MVATIDGWRHRSDDEVIDNTIGGAQSARYTDPIDTSIDTS